MRSKKWLSIVTAMAMLLSMMRFSAFALEGSGTQDEPYLISSEADLAAFRASVNEGTAYAGQVVQLTETITVTDAYYTDHDAATTDSLIGSSAATPFQGTFDGSGHEILGLQSGLFGYISEGAVVRDLALTCENSSYSALADVVSGSVEKPVLIEGVTVNGTLRSAAGLIRATQSLSAAGTETRATEITIKDCTNNAAITRENSDGIGGIVNVNTAASLVLSGCVNNGTLFATNSAEIEKEVHIGGIVRYVNGTTPDKYFQTTFENCVNNGDITTVQYSADTRTNVGGLLSTAQGGSFTFIDCKNTGDISGTMDNGTDGNACVGGLAGKFNGYPVLVSGFVNTGNVTAAATGSAKAYAGGVASFTDNSGADHVLMNCTVSGTITATAAVEANAYAGGIIGGISKGTTSGQGTVLIHCSAGDTDAIGMQNASAKLTYAVAQVGDTYYATLADALAAAQAGDTVTLLQDVVIGENDYNAQVSGTPILYITKAITLDLDGYTLKIDNGGVYGVYINLAEDAKATIKNGTIDDVSGSSSAVASSVTIYLSGGDLETENLTIQTQNPEKNTYSYCIYAASSLESNVTLGNQTQLLETARTYEGAPSVDHDNGYYGVVGVAIRGHYTTAEWKSLTDKDAAERSSLTVADGVTIEVNEFAVATNGAYHPVDVTINGGSLTAKQSVGIYFPGDGVLTINGGEITGSLSGVELRAGTLNMTGGSVTALNCPTVSQGNGNGTSVDGAAIAVSQHTTNLDISVNISGGTLTGFIPLYEEDLQDESSDNISLSVTGGNFICQGEAEAGSAAVSQPIYSENCTAFVSGGAFNGAVEDKLLSQTAVLSANPDGTYVVVADSTLAREITVSFEATEVENVYHIVLNAEDGKIMNRFMSAELAFIFETDDAIAYDVTGAENVNVIYPEASGKSGYEFNLDGSAPSLSGNQVVIGSIAFTGYGVGTLQIDSTYANIVHTAKTANNIVDKFTAEGDGISIGKLNLPEAAEITLTVPTNTLTVNIAFPNAISDNDAAYQDMKVTISGGDLTAPIEKTLGLNTDDAIALQTASVTLGEETYDGYTFTQELMLERSYTITVEGAGYRTARYTVNMNADKTLTFWNNVMDTATVIETGKDASAVKATFLAGDIVKDNQINLYDLSAVVSYFGEVDLQDSNPAYAKYDLNRDGRIDSKDVALVLVSWGN